MRKCQPVAKLFAVALLLLASNALAQVQTTINWSDHYYNPNESGWGVTFTDHDTNAFLVYYTYAADGHNIWFTLPGGTWSNNRCVFSGPMYQTTGPGYQLVAFNPANVTVAQAGTGSIDFCPSGQSAGNAVFSYTLNGVSHTKNVSRLAFGNASARWPNDFTDLWWNPGESGWGMNITHKGDNMFVAWYGYDTSGRPLFATMPGGTFSNASTFTGRFYTTTGPWFGSLPFSGALVQARDVGSATLTFNGADNGTFQFTIDGVTQSKSITRQVFASTGKEGASVGLTFSMPMPGATDYSRSGSVQAILNVHRGTYLGHSATALCNGIQQSVVSAQLAAGTTSGTISISPQTLWPASQNCTFSITVNASNGVTHSGTVSAGTASGITPKLLALIQGDTNNGYMDINTDTFLGTQRNPGGSFYGASYDASTRNIVLASGLAGSTQAFSFVNVDTNAVTAGLNLSQQSTDGRAPVACEPSGSSRVGTCYYGFTGTGNGRIVVGQGRNVVETLVLPDAAQGRQPVQMLVFGNELLIRTSSPQGVTDVIHRLNLAGTRSFGTPITLTVKTTGFDIRNTTLYVSGFTTQFAYKVLTVNLNSGTVSDLGLSLQASQDVCVNADTMFVSDLTSVKAYRLSDTINEQSLVGTVITTSSPEKLVCHGSFVYVSRPAGFVQKVNATTRAVVSELAVPRIGSGDLVIIAP